MIPYTFKCPKCATRFPVHYYGQGPSTKKELSDVLERSPIYVQCDCGEPLTIKTLKEGAYSEEYRRDCQSVREAKERLKAAEEKMGKYEEWDIVKQTYLDY